MQKKVWKKPPNKTYDVGKCKWCYKNIVSSDPFVVFADKSQACLKCYHNSGASLPMFRK